jgi:hypothetical protein
MDLSIKLTSHDDGRPVYVPHEAIAFFEYGDDCTTVIRLDGPNLEVTETIEQILQLIAERRLH